MLIFTYILYLFVRKRDNSMEPSHGKTGGEEPVHDLENAQDPATRDATEQGNRRASLVIKKKVNKVTILSMAVQ